MKACAGFLLVASPHLLDENFVRTVTLIIQHGKEGTLGVILNRPSDKTIADLWGEVSDIPCDNSRPVHIGGPVPGPLIAVHSHESLAEHSVIKDVYCAARRELLDKLVRRHDGSMKVFLGHAGWGPGQLDNELEEGSWYLAPATSELIFRNEGDLWEIITRMVGRAALSEILDISELPDDPSVN